MNQSALLVSRTEAAQMLGGVHPRTVDNMIKSNQLEARPVGRRKMIVRASVERYINGDSGAAQAQAKPRGQQATPSR